MALTLWTRRLFVLALLVAGLGTAAGFWAALLEGYTDPWVTLHSVYGEPFRAWFWRPVLVSTLGLSGLAAAVTLSEGFIGRRLAKRLEFAGLGDRTLRDTLVETARRVDACARHTPVDAVTALDELVRGAVALGASDIHLSPTSAGLRITYRVEGRLHLLVTLAPDTAPLLATRVKVLANLDTYKHTQPQDGRLSVLCDEQRVELRVSTLPTEQGERVVLRLVSGSRSIRSIDDLGFSPEVLGRLREALSRSQGLLFVTGPVGNGKTTTLYASLRHIAASRGQTTSMVTLEDPIELELPFATQTQMNAKSGLTFASTLRSVLRQDPNVLMLGEIRDRETAEIATQAGLSGHLILTTVHAESAAGPFARLVDMDVEAFAVASATLASVSQRLLRELCPLCRVAQAPSAAQLERFEKLGISLPPATYYESRGCKQCDNEGFAGRIVVAELLSVTAAVRKAIVERRGTKEIEDVAVREGMVPMLRDGLDKAAQGVTSLAEVLRVIG